jgi:hypothetical protein
MKINVPVPDIHSQKTFVELLQKVKCMKEYQLQINNELMDLMPSLLDKAFKGEA